MIYSKWIIKETKTGFEMELDECFRFTGFRCEVKNFGQSQI